MPHLSRLKRGSTLLDLCVIFVIVATLVAIVIPMVLSANERSSRYRCGDNLRQLGVQLRAYAADNQGRYPTTRPTTGPVVIPDVTGAGAAAADPFGPNGPGPNNVPASLFLLVREQRLPSDTLICPATTNTPDRFEGKNARDRSNFTDIRVNLSYSLQNPYPNDAAKAAGFEWNDKLTASYVLAADKNPGLTSGPKVLRVRSDSSSDLIRLANSNNHSKKGQNVLFADGRVEFHDTPFAGINGDNIYATKNFQLLDSPQDPTDSILLPAEELTTKPATQPFTQPAK